MFESRAERRFRQEWDQRFADSEVKKDVMSSWRLGGSEIRVQMPDGQMYRRNGKECCGCGQADRNIKPYRSPIPHPSESHHHDHNHNDRENHNDDEPRGFFCSWI